MNATRSYEKNYSENRFQNVMNDLRSYLTKTASKRSSKSITADDVHEFLNTRGITRNEVRARLAFTKSVLREPNFRPTGYVVASSRPAARGRSITEWKLV